MSQAQHVQWDLINKTSKPSGVSLGSSGFVSVESLFGQVWLSSGLVESLFSQVELSSGLVGSLSAPSIGGPKLEI